MVGSNKLYTLLRSGQIKARACFEDKIDDGEHGFCPSCRSPLELIGLWVEIIELDGAVW